MKDIVCWSQYGARANWPGPSVARVEPRVGRRRSLQRHGQMECTDCVVARVYYKPGCLALIVRFCSVIGHMWSNFDWLTWAPSVERVLRDSQLVLLTGNCSEKFLLHNIFGFHVYITNIYVKLSTETVNMQKSNFEQFWTGKAGNQLRRSTAGSTSL